jgi:hypothetical protein
MSRLERNAKILHFIGSPIIPKYYSLLLDTYNNAKKMPAVADPDRFPYIVSMHGNPLWQI